MIKMTMDFIKNTIEGLLTSRRNVAVFTHIKITSNPINITYYGKKPNNGGEKLMRFKAAKNGDKTFYSELAFVMPREPFGKELTDRFIEGDTVNIIATVETYKAKVYGKLGKPIKYPDGTQRYTTKVRFRINKITKA